MTKEELKHKIITGQIDVNLQQKFFHKVVQGLIDQLNHIIKVRDEFVPHIILNTGDDIMYLENKGQDMGVEPLEVSNENGIYNKIPRCVMNVGGIDVQEDQLTSPYTKGMFNMEIDGEIWSLIAEYRRLPLTIGVSLKYYVDSFTDVMSLTQSILSNLLHIRTYDVSYMDQVISASYKVPTSIQPEKMIEFDGGTTDMKLRTISMELEVETNFPVIHPDTILINMEGIIGGWEGVVKSQNDINVERKGGLNNIID